MKRNADRNGRKTKNRDGNVTPQDAHRNTRPNKHMGNINTITAMGNERTADHGRQDQETGPAQTTTRRGTRENETTCKNNITYDTQRQEWICQKCPKTLDNQSLRNAIQHASKHVRENAKENNPKWQPWTETETLLRGCRIRTLRKMQKPHE